MKAPKGQRCARHGLNDGQERQQGLKKCEAVHCLWLETDMSPRLQGNGRILMNWALVRLADKSPENEI